MPDLNQLSEADFADDFAGQPPTPHPGEDLARARRRRSHRLITLSVTAATVGLAALITVLGVTLHTTSTTDPVDLPTSAAVSASMATYDGASPGLSRSDFVTATFRVVEGCVYFESAADHTLALAVFPRGEYRWDAGRIVGPRLSMQPGAYFRLGADQGLVTQLEQTPGLDVPGSCERTDAFYTITTDDPPAITSSRSSRRDQMLVRTAIEPMWKYVAGDGGDDAHYARASVDPGELTAEIRWHGQVPAEIAALAGTNADGVRVTIVQVPYSQRDVSRAADSVYQLANNGRIPRPSAVGANDAFDGIEVSFPNRDLDELDQVTVSAAVEQVTGMPVTLDATSDLTEGPLTPGPTPR